MYSNEAAFVKIFLLESKLQMNTAAVKLVHGMVTLRNALFRNAALNDVLEALISDLLVLSGLSRTYIQLGKPNILLCMFRKMQLWRERKAFPAANQKA
jgi:hypothetical protein